MTQEKPDKPDKEIESAPPSEVPCFDVLSIVGERREAHLLHRGETYRLRITSNQKLILTK